MPNKSLIMLGCGVLISVFATTDTILAAPQSEISDKRNVEKAEEEEGKANREIKRDKVDDIVETSLEEIIEAQNERNGKNDLFFVLENTLLNNKEIIATQKGLKASHETHNLAMSGFKPTIEGTVEYDVGHERKWNSKFEQHPNSNDPRKNALYNKSSERSSVKKGGIVVRQNLFKGGSDIASLNEADASIKAQWSEYEAVKQKVLCSVANLYFEILAKQKELQHLKSLLELRTSSLEVVTEMYNTGAEKYVSVMQAKAYYAETEAQLAKSEAEYKSLCAQFLEQTGIPVPAHMGAPAKLFDTNMKEEQARDIAIKFNPHIIASIDRVKAAKAAITKPNSSLCPSIDLLYRYDQSLDSAHKKNTDRNRYNQNNSAGHVFGVSMTVPIYDAGVGNAKKRQASEIATKTAVEKEKVVQEVVAQISKVWADLEAAKRNIISAHTAVEARRLALHDTEEEHKAGIKIMNDVLDAQQKLFESQTADAQAQKSYFISQCNALSLLGRMTPKYLKLKVQDFNYKAHYKQTKGVF